LGLGVRVEVPSWLSVLLLIVVGCSASPRADVIAADGALCDITRRLAADALRVTCLLGANDDPHQLQLSPEQSRQIREARLVLINGYGLTPALERLPGVVRVAEQAVPQSPWLRSSADGGGSDHHQHGHGDQDPHVWQDPRQAIALVAEVSGRLQALDPAAAPAIQARGQTMQASLRTLHRWNLAQFATIPGPRTLATDHRAFASLARAYGLRELALLDADSASQSLRPAAMTALVQQLEQLRPGSLFSEQHPPSRAMVRISDLSGVPIAPRVLRADHAGDNLMATLTANTCLIVEGLGGRCDRSAEAVLLRQWNAIR
jgi:zinc/manganese transport system substrate-binding protein